MSSLLGSRVCTKCKQEKPETEFYVKDKKTGRRFARCKPCMNADHKDRYHADIEESRRRGREHAKRWARENRERYLEARRRWTEANRERINEEARRRHNKPAARAQRAAYRAANREKRLAYNRDYRERNKEAIDAANAEYREKNRDALKARQRQWRETNPERYAEIHAGWKQRNPDLVKAAAHRRRMKQRAGGTYTPAEWEAVKQRHDYRCVMCGRHESEAPLTVDHVVPLSRGGRNTADNLEPLCRRCNCQKHARDWDYRWRQGDRAWPRQRAISSWSFTSWSRTGRRAR